MSAVEYTVYEAGEGPRPILRCGSCDESEVMQQARPGEQLIVGLRCSGRAHRVVDGLIEPWQPPAPSDDEWQTWSWEPAVERWVPTQTPAAVARYVRAERSRRMVAADWVTLRAMRTGTVIPTDWAAYLQALADLPAQPGFPLTVDWPTPPT